MTWKLILNTLFGEVIGVVAASANHLTSSEVTIIVSVIGAVVPLGTAWILDRHRPRETELDRLRRENRELKAKEKLDEP